MGGPKTWRRRFARLEALYPRDQATGYRLADLRGAVTVTIPVTSAR
jgi:hypothetical protein